jgi:hypothetical protein
MRAVSVPKANRTFLRSTGYDDETRPGRRQVSLGEPLGARLTIVLRHPLATRARSASEFERFLPIWCARMGTDCRSSSTPPSRSRRRAGRQRSERASLTPLTGIAMNVSWSMLVTWSAPDGHASSACNASARNICLRGRLSLSATEHPAPAVQAPPILSIRPEITQAFFWPSAGSEVPGLPARSHLPPYTTEQTQLGGSASG